MAIHVTNDAAALFAITVSITSLVKLAVGTASCARGLLIRVL